MLKTWLSGVTCSGFCGGLARCPNKSNPLGSLFLTGSTPVTGGTSFSATPAIGNSDCTDRGAGFQTAVVAGAGNRSRAVAAVGLVPGLAGCCKSCHPTSAGGCSRDAREFLCSAGRELDCKRSGSSKEGRLGVGGVVGGGVSVAASRRLACKTPEWGTCEGANKFTSGDGSGGGTGYSIDRLLGVNFLWSHQPALTGTRRQQPNRSSTPPASGASQGEHPTFVFWHRACHTNLRQKIAGS